MKKTLGPKDLSRTTAPEAGDDLELTTRRIARSLGTRAVGIEWLKAPSGIDIWTPLAKQPALEVCIYNDLVDGGRISVRYAGQRAFLTIEHGRSETLPVVADASELEVSHIQDGEASITYRWRNG
jgi:hypothetical protein